MTGDTIREDEVIAQIETDKVTIDVKYTGKEPGTITQLVIAPGDIVQTGMVVCSVDVGKVSPGAAEMMPAAPKAAAVTGVAPAAAAAPPPPKAAAAHKVSWLTRTDITTALLHDIWYAW